MIDPTKEELMHAIENIGASFKEKIFADIEADRKEKEEQDKADKRTEMESKLKKQLDAEKIAWSSDQSATIYIIGAGIMITVDEIKGEYSGGLVYSVGYYNTDMDHSPEGEPLKMRTTDVVDDVISWAAEAVTCPFCHSRQLEDTPNGPEIVCANCGNSWR